MRLLLFISFITFSSFSIDVILDVFQDITVLYSLVDLPEEGSSESGSEKDTSENSEDDSEKDSFSQLELSLLDALKVPLAKSTQLLSIGQHMEIPVPPPELTRIQL